jgi:hypothetical protein
MGVKKIGFSENGNVKTELKFVINPEAVRTFITYDRILKIKTHILPLQSIEYDGMHCAT